MTTKILAELDEHIYELIKNESLQTGKSKSRIVREILADRYGTKTLIQPGPTKRKTIDDDRQLVT